MSKKGTKNPPLGNNKSTHGGESSGLKLWLRLMICTKHIENELKTRLRTHYDISLARFDYMAQLYRYPEGLKMNELSRHLMVTGGNITGLTDELSREGLVMRQPSPTDRRAWILLLTEKGKETFEIIAEQHNLWVTELLSGLEQSSINELSSHLKALRASFAS